MDDTIFIIDDDVRRRASMSYYLNNLGYLAEPFESIEEFVRSWPKSGILLVYDDGRTVGSLMHEICNRHTWLPIVAFSENSEPSQIVDAVLDGAIGYAAWPSCGYALAEVLGRARSRSVSMLANGPRQALAMAHLDKLSRREREILAGIVEGLSNRLIGQHLAISPRTVELHRANLLAKIGAKNSASAIRMAIEASLPAFEHAAPNI